MSSEERCLVMFVAGFLVFSGGCGYFINQNSKINHVHAERMLIEQRESDRQKDSTPIVESCAKHPAGRKLVVQ